MNVTMCNIYVRWQLLSICSNDKISSINGGTLLLSFHRILFILALFVLHLFFKFELFLLSARLVNMQTIIIMTMNRIRLRKQIQLHETVNEYNYRLLFVAH